MNETVKLMYRLFLGKQSFKVVSCIRTDDTVEIKIRLWARTKSYAITLKPR